MDISDQTHLKTNKNTLWVAKNITAIMDYGHFIKNIFVALHAL